MSGLLHEQPIRLSFDVDTNPVNMILSAILYLVLIVLLTETEGALLLIMVIWTLAVEVDFAALLTVTVNE